MIKKKSDNLFNEITNRNSKYYIPKNRPIFKGKEYVISNYRTGSAAALLTTLFQDNEIGIIIGTSVGNNPTGATTYTPMIYLKQKRVYQLQLHIKKDQIKKKLKS